MSLAWVAAATQSSAQQMSPGIGGFLAVFLLALACWLLFRSMRRHLRRVDWRAENWPAPQAPGTGAQVPGAESRPEGTPAP